MTLEYGHYADDLDELTEALDLKSAIHTKDRDNTIMLFVPRGSAPTGKERYNLLEVDFGP